MVTINKDLCVGCGACVAGCPEGLFDIGDDGKAFVKDASKCKDCKECEQVCPVEAIKC
jgi:NAD-dependent dihydropyrimidine dehydrogenase PreA subunit